MKTNTTLSPKQRVEQACIDGMLYNSVRVVSSTFALQLATELEAAQKELEIKQLLPFHGCFSGDCPSPRSGGINVLFSASVSMSYSAILFATK